MRFLVGFIRKIERIPKGLQKGTWVGEVMKFLFSLNDLHSFFTWNEKMFKTLLVPGVYY